VLRSQVGGLQRKLEEEQEVTDAARSQLYDYKQMVTMVGEPAGQEGGSGRAELHVKLGLWPGGSGVGLARRALGHKTGAAVL
jgi:hypothetical protein